MARTRKVDPANAAERANAEYNWMTPEEFGARAGGVSAEQVRRWIKARKLRALNIALGGGRPVYRIDPAEGDRFIREELAA